MTGLKHASPLLNGARLIAGTHRLRLLEVELYVYHPRTWADPYVHCDPRQLKPATWYVHRMGGSHKQGTFKGLDLTAGDGEHTHVGILLRSLETAQGERVMGPCNCVHHLMACLGEETLATFDPRINAHGALDCEGALYVQAVDEDDPREVYASTRVGLGLKRVLDHPTMVDYLHAPLRYTTAPDLTKGRQLNVLHMVAEGMDTSKIRALTRASNRTVLKIRTSILEGQRAKLMGLYDSVLALRQHKDIAFIYGYLNAEHIAISIQD